MDEIGLVDDAAFASDWVSSRQQRRHLSRSALRRELHGKGVAREEIEEALRPVGIAEEYEAAISLARRRQAGMAQLPRDVQYRRLAGVLGRRGFGGSVTSQVLSELLTGGNGGPAEDGGPHLGSADA
jgi:regulatory protein